ncbi:zinc protease [Sphingomonas vulcanisoli]|uniref:Zinc protease n=1 Tax=Sphingomonas vulcanisoli TaxID=1658060 RepID=A0ABX0U0I0_9SPHN|nr:M16 family metallopeptidase [Sphingomonas vulcanisoli]NIJ09505.1 zinc protease [Sphingomonas vulcanisoli]
MKILSPLIILALTALPQAALAKAKRPGVWAQTYTDRPADPSIRFGQLPNGLRYAIRKNATPASEISLRLYIGSGSLDEPKGSEGLAHFLEHIAFRGSANVADGEAMRILARQGLAVGADANAGTTPESTVFSFDFPQGGKPAIDTGLMLFREIAGKLTISDKSVDAERGVILSEERLRDAPGFHAAKAAIGFMLQGQLGADRLPIGHTDVIRHATAAQLRAFYEAWYRPENAAIVAVGDFDPDIVETQIKALFADWQGKGTPPQPPVLGPPARRGEEVRLFSEPGAPTSAQINWVRPFDDRADTPDREREDYDGQVAQVVLNQRLQDIARRAGAPFLGAALGQNNTLDSANITTLAINPLPDAPVPSIRAAIDEQQRALRFGISQTELSRALQTISTTMANAAASANSRPSPAIATTIVRDIATNEVTRSPEQNQADIQEWNRFLSLRNVNNALKRSFSGSGPLIFFSSAQPLTGGEAALRSAYDDAGKGLAAPAAAADLPGWPYTNFGTPGRVVQKREIADLGVTVVTFANGVVLGIKPQKMTANEAWVNTSFGAGRLGLPPEKAQSYWMVGLPPILIEGGTGKLAAGEMQRVLTGKSVNVGLALGDDIFALQGKTVTRDLLTELQLQAAYLTDPGFRPESVTRAQIAVGQMIAQIDSTPTGVAKRDIALLMHNGDPRWAPLPTAAQLAQSRPQDLIALIDTALGSALQVVIVGDVTVDQAIDAVAATLGALPPRTPRVDPQPRDIRPPAPNMVPKRLDHSGRADQAVAFETWPTDGYFANPQEALALMVTADVIKSRLFDQLREAEGATYSPEVSAPSSNVLPHFGSVEAQVEVAPEKTAAVFTLLDSITADLRAKPLSADELDRAKQPLIDKRKRDLQGNSFWTGIVSLALRDPRALDAARTMVSGLEKVSAADVQRVSAKYLLPNRAIRVVVKAKGAP